MITGSAAASTTAVVLSAPAAITTAATKAVSAYQNLQYASTSLEAAKTVTFNTSVRYAPTAAQEVINFETWFGGDVKKYAEYKTVELAIGQIAGPLAASLSRLFKAKTKSCGDAPVIQAQEAISLTKKTIELPKSKVEAVPGVNGGVMVHTRT